MADKFTEFAGRMGKAPKGVGTGLKFLVAAAAAVYGIKESIYTGILPSPLLQLERRPSANDIIISTFILETIRSSLFEA